VGGRVLVGVQGTPDHRVLAALLRLQGTVGLDILKTQLKDFTWSGKQPDDTLAGMLSLGLRGEF
jgi:hypothetical protein